MKNPNDTIENRTRDLPACSAVPQPTAPPRARRNVLQGSKISWLNGQVTDVSIDTAVGGVKCVWCGRVFFFQTGDFYLNRKTGDTSIDWGLSGSVIVRYKCMCFVQAKRARVSEGDTTRSTERRKIRLVYEELREKYGAFSFFRL